MDCIMTTQMSSRDVMTPFFLWQLKESLHQTPWEDSVVQGCKVVLKVSVTAPTLPAVQSAEMSLSVFTVKRAAV